MIVPLAARVVQLPLSAVALAISIVLINGYGTGHNPSVIDYGATCGGGALAISAVGILGIFYERLQDIVILLDTLAAFLLLAGGLAFAIQAKIGSCADKNGYLTDHASLFTPSIYKYAGESDSNYSKDILYDTENRCRMVQATTTFVWLAFGSFLVTIALRLRSKRARGSFI